MLNLSPFPVEANGHFPFLYNDRNLPISTGVVQHLFQVVVVGEYIYIFNSFSFFAVSFTSFYGEGSGIFSKN